MNSYIDYNGKRFAYREIYHEAAGMDVLIGSGSLDMELIDEDGGYRSEHARFVDEKFYGYVEDKYFTLSDSDFELVVNELLD